MDSNIYGNGTDPKLALLVYFWPLFSSWRWPKLRKISSRPEKLPPLSYPNMSNEVFISSSLSRKNKIPFCNIWDIFIRKQGGVTSQRRRIKIWKILFYPYVSWSTLGFSNLVGFLGTIPIFFKKLKLNYLMQNLVLNRSIGTNFKSQKWRSKRVVCPFNLPFSFWDQFNQIKVFPLFRTILDS